MHRRQLTDDGNVEIPRSAGREVRAHYVRSMGYGLAVS
jgi:hypothetical protein